MERFGQNIWILHSLACAGFSALGLLLTLIEARDSGAGHWFSLQRVGTNLLWLSIGCYALAATLILAFFRDALGVPLSYLVALPIAALLAVSLVWTVEHRTTDTTTSGIRTAQGDLASRLRLLSWSTETVGDDTIHLRAAITAQRAVEVSFSALGTDDQENVLAESEVRPFARQPRRLAPGESAQLETVLRFPGRPTPKRLVLFFDTWALAETGQFLAHGLISYHSKAAQEELAGPARLHRHLPAL